MIEYAAPTLAMCVLLEWYNQIHQSSMPCTVSFPFALTHHRHMATILCLTVATGCVWLHHGKAVALEVLRIQHFASVACLSVRVPMGCVPLTLSYVHRLCSQP